LTGLPEASNVASPGVKYMVYPTARHRKVASEADCPRLGSNRSGRPFVAPSKRNIIKSNPNIASPALPVIVHLDVSIGGIHNKEHSGRLLV